MKKSEEVEIVNYLKEVLEKTKTEATFNTKILKIEDKVFFIINFNNIVNLSSLCDNWDSSTLSRNLIIVLQQPRRENLSLGIISKTNDYSRSLLFYSLNLSLLDSINQFLNELEDEDLSSVEPDFKIQWNDSIFHKNKRLSNIRVNSNNKSKINSIIELNVNSSSSFISENGIPTTQGCVREFTRILIDLNHFEEILLVNLNYRLSQLSESKEIIREVNEILKLKNKEVKFYYDKKVVLSGKLQGINENGDALLENNGIVSSEKADYVASQTSLKNSETYNKCHCISQFTDKRSIKFYYFFTASVLTLFARFFYNRNKSGIKA